jgi:2-phosphosulfolactate phosphatase
LNSSPIVRICLTPALYPIYKDENSIVVVVDIFRATSAISTALHHGMKAVIPVADINASAEYQGNEYIHAAERGGEVVNGFTYGNSPLSYINNPEVKGKTLVLSTTNGTQAIEAAKNSLGLTTGAFSNISALTHWLANENKSVMILCAGWKNRMNLEDTLFAGALTQRLLQRGFAFDIDSDAAIAAHTLYEQSKNNMHEFLKDSSHRNRLSKLNLEEDIDYCLQHDTAEVVPFLQDGKLINIFHS